MVASGVKVTLEPAAKVNVSVLLSAAIVVVPTVILLNAFWLASALVGAWVAWECSYAILPLSPRYAVEEVSPKAKLELISI